MKELNNERIDVIEYSDDVSTYLARALSPAKVQRVDIDRVNGKLTAVVEDDQLSLAIGKRGQNVRLASRLTNWRLDVVSESEYNKKLKEGYTSLLELSGVGEKLATALYETGFRSAEDIAKSDAADLATVRGISDRKAQELVQEALDYIEQLGYEEDTAHDEGELSGGVDEQNEGL